MSEEGHASLVHSPMKVDRVLANHSLSSTASQGRSNIISFFSALGITPPGEDTKEGKDMERTWNFPVDEVTIIFLSLYHVSFPFPLSVSWELEREGNDRTRETGKDDDQEERESRSHSFPIHLFLYFRLLSTSHPSPSITKDS